MTLLPTAPGEADDSPAGRVAAWPVRGSLMSYRSVASRKRTAVERLQARAQSLTAKAFVLEEHGRRLVDVDAKSRRRPRHSTSDAAGSANRRVPAPPPAALGSRAGPAEHRTAKDGLSPV